MRSFQDLPQTYYISHGPSIACMLSTTRCRSLVSIIRAASPKVFCPTIRGALGQIYFSADTEAIFSEMS